MSSLQSLILPIAVILALTFAFGTIRRSVRSAPIQGIVFGLVFGGAAIIAMADPVTLGFGVIVDLRTLMVALAIAFSGPLAGAIAVVLAAAFRFYLGGLGAPSGILALFMGYGLGLFWLYSIKPRIKRPALQDTVLGIAISLALFSGFLLPPEVRWTFLFGVAPYVAMSNIIGAIVLGHLFRREVRFQENEQTLDRIASIDPLTGALNRRGTEIRLRDLPAETPPGRAFLYFDIDKFKDVNDIHGHAAGDKALKVVAQRVKGCIREDAILSRLGGDEFAVMLPGVTADEARTVSQRVCDVIRAHELSFQGHVIPLTISVGAHWTSGPSTFEAIREKADRNLLSSKNDGRDRATISFDDTCAGVRLDAVAA